MQQKFTFFILPVLALSTGFAHAQSFTNGSLEAPSVVACSYIRTFQFSTFMGNTGYSYSTIDIVSGIKGMIYFLDATCNDGSAQNGSNYLGLAAYDNGSIDGMSLRLTAPLVANKTYVLSFYIKKAKGSASIPLEIGYTTDSLKFGTLSGTVPAPTTQTWTRQTVNIRPTVPVNFITVQAVKGNSGTFNASFTHVDNFTIAAGTAVAAPDKQFALSPAPNPFQSSFSFKLADGFAFPGTVRLTDITGRLVFHESISTQEVHIPRGELSAGMYMLSLKDVNGAEVNSKVVAY